MTTADNLLMAERLTRLCDQHGMKYTVNGPHVRLHADSERYKAFAADNVLFVADSVETCIGWLMGVFGGYASQLVERKAFTPKEAT